MGKPKNIRMHSLCKDNNTSLKEAGRQKHTNGFNVGVRKGSKDKELTMKTTPVVNIEDQMIILITPYQEQDSVQMILTCTITPSPYTYNPHSEEEATTSSTKNSGNIFDHEEDSRNYQGIASTDQKWIEAMEIELDSINKNNTWTLTTLPPNQKAIGLKWVSKPRGMQKET
ncbi:hypothetical protein Tco_0688658 [Tanacetum coccineum]|uniref:Reverse transcriptase n=1 Tax=Tanacetum coccineum TaxID=301880 RepID=A0ABQ4WK84_9ASTR